MKLIRNLAGLFLLVILHACGGGRADTSLVEVIYRGDDVLVVDGREYSRVLPDAWEAEFGADGPSLAGWVNVLGKRGVDEEFIRAQLARYGLTEYSIGCMPVDAEYQCVANSIVVPDEWTEQWRRAASEWHWVEDVWFDRKIRPD